MSTRQPGLGKISEKYSLLVVNEHTLGVVSCNALLAQAIIQRFP
jgi:hypothetical protein